MQVESDCPLAVELADELRDASEGLVSRWLERILDRVSVESDQIFPSDELLDHVPRLVQGIADYVEDPADEITADIPVVAKAMELGEIRHSQGFEAHQILKEYEVLGGILFTYIAEIVDGIDQPCSRGELLTCGHRLFRAIAVVQQVTLNKYLQAAHQEIREREDRLRGFGRALSHEIRNNLGRIGNAVEMLGEDFVLSDEKQRRQFQSMARESMDGMGRVVDNLIELSRVESESRRQQNVLLEDAIAEVRRQLREFARAREVDVRIADDLPRIDVPASAIELVLSNYVSNAIKYHDPKKTKRWVEVSAAVREMDDADYPELVIEVTDNGRGVPVEAREKLFERFFRAHEDSGPPVEGTGLGLAIVKDTADALGGRVWTDFSREGETVFVLALPSRRENDVSTSDAPPG